MLIICGANTVLSLIYIHTYIRLSLVSVCQPVEALDIAGGQGWPNGLKGSGQPVPSHAICRRGGGYNYMAILPIYI